MKSFVAILLLLATISCSQKKPDQEINLAMDSLLIQKMKESGIVGMGAAIFVDKKLAWSNGFGYADKENQKPFTTSTIMNIASISKTITGASLMRAIEDNKLSLDEDINSYLTFKVVNPYFPNEKITLRNLATHTSGIVDQSAIYDATYHYGGDAPEQLGEFLKNYFDPSGTNYSKDNFLNAKPGTRSNYSNIAAGLAGYIIEEATGKKLDAYSKEYIFKPLGMNDTGWFLSKIDLSTHSNLYMQEGDSIKLIQLYGLTTYPDGGVRTSISDLSKFFSCLLNDGALNGVRILKAASVQEMKRPQFSETMKPDSVNLNKDNAGIFWSIEDLTKVGHSGGDPGVMTNMQYDLSKDIGIIFFINTMPNHAYDAFVRINDALWELANGLKKPTAN